MNDVDYILVDNLGYNQFFEELEKLKQLRYLIFKEYDTGMYTIHLTK